MVANYVRKPSAMQTEILQFLLKCHVATVYQIATIVDYKYPYTDKFVANDETPKGKSPNDIVPNSEIKVLDSETKNKRVLWQTNRAINRLQKRGWVDKDYMTNSKNGMCAYFLSAAGYNLITDLLGLPINRNATGFDLDLNYYDHNKFKVKIKKNSQLPHLLAQTKLITEVHKVNKGMSEKNNRQTNICSYRNGRYTARNLPKVNQSDMYKADGEIEIGADRYFIEIDRRTERSGHLDNKFIHYSYRLNYERTLPKTLYKGMFVIYDELESVGNVLSDSQKAYMRYRSFYESYHAKCRAHVPYFDIVGSPLSDLATMIRTLHPSYYENFQDELLVQLNRFFPNLGIYDGKVKVAKLEPHKNAVLLEILPKEEYALFFNVEGFVMNSWVIFSELYDKMKDIYKVYNKDVKIYPICTYSSLAPVPPVQHIEELNTQDERELKLYRLLNKVQIIQLNRETPYFMDVFFKHVSSSPFNKYQ